ncbi:MAG: transporter substrate-binding domain-containing protein [Novosphingobium sp.]|jgi:ABC-type amino acid transport substrate-binding protein|uniref:transporter substrate-binding domain-containing protein n=1 Tax=Novosphingobium sp. TaxID=1874826 RepID=UPI003B9924AF
MNLRLFLSAGLRVAVGLSLLPLALASAEAQVQSKYDRVLQNKKIIAGAQEGTPPFGYVDEKGELAGWAVDLSKALHVLIEKKMETKLELEFRKVTPQTRIPLIVNGSLDWVLGSTGKTVEREQVVDFSLINNAVCVKTLHRKSMPVNAVSDLAGKRLGVTNGSVEQKLLTEMGQTGKISPPAQLVVFPTHAVGFLALEQGRTDAHVTLDVALKSLAMRAQNPGEWAVSGPDLMCTPNGIILPQNDSKWKRTVDHALCYFIHTGGYTKLWDEWFGESSPKAGFALPISEQTKTVLYGQCPFGIEDWLKAK